jgi:hypothetical protein
VDNSPAELGFNVAAGNRIYLSLQVENADLGWQFPEVQLNNAYVTLVSANGSIFIYELLALENLPSSSQLSVYLNYQQLDANLNVTRTLSLYDTASYAVNGVNPLVITNSVLVDAVTCNGGSSQSSSSSETSQSSSTSSASSSSPAVICEAQAGLDTGNANLGFGIVQGQNVYMSLQLRNADYTSPIQISLPNADVFEVFSSGGKRIFQVSAQQHIPGSANFEFNYSYQQAITNQSVWRDVAVFDTVTGAINGIFPLTSSNNLLIDASNCGQQ